jgi:hypothetical protein
MLALEPSALLLSSPGASGGFVEKGPYSIGEDEINGFVSQEFVRDQLNSSKPGNLEITRCPKLADIKAIPAAFTGSPFSDHWGELLYCKFVQADSSTAGYQILRNLHLAYPADEDDPDKLAGAGRFPLVILLHGNHQSVEPTSLAHIPSHLGYIYLQRELAAWGIISVSLDTNIGNFSNSWIQMRAESVLRTLDSLSTLDQDTSSRLYQRIDFDRVGLFGHSRGGDAVVRAAIINSRAADRKAAGIVGKYTIKAVCAVAPTDFTGSAATGRSNLDSSQAPCFIVLYGALDGDVSGVDQEAGGGTGTGFRLYDRADTEKAMIFLEKCNHNRFNDVWTEDDSFSLHDNALLSRASHRSLAKEYVGGLFRWRLLGNVASRELFDGSARNATGEVCSIQWSLGQRTKLDDMEGATGPGISRQPPNPQLGDLSIAATRPIPSTTESDIYTNHQTMVLITDPNPGSNPMAPYGLVFSPAQNWTIYTHLIFRACADADVSINFVPGAILPPDFTLVITDSSANSARITAASLRTPDRPRAPVPHLYPLTSSTTGLVTGHINCSVIHLETYPIHLSQVAGVDLTSISKVSIEIPPGTTQRCFFDSLELLKYS